MEKVTQVLREVIDSKLLAALDDEAKVAVLYTVDDLDFVIGLLGLASVGGLERSERRWQMVRDLTRLRLAAFGDLVKR